MIAIEAPASYDVANLPLLGIRRKAWMLTQRPFHLVHLLGLFQDRRGGVAAVAWQYRGLARPRLFIHLHLSYKMPLPGHARLHCGYTGCHCGDCMTWLFWLRAFVPLLVSARVIGSLVFERYTIMSWARALHHNVVHCLKGTLRLPLLL
jgi:hypothetical protein